VAQLQLPDRESVELVTVDRQMAFAVVLPLVLLIDRDSHQVRHDFREAMIMVAFHPHHLDAVLGVRQLADVTEKLPVLFGQPAKIQVGEDVAEEDQAAELH
jgi:hypothetical protein